MTQGKFEQGFEIYADGQALAIPVFENGKWCHGNLLPLYEEALAEGAKHLLVDKRRLVSPWDASVCKESVKAVGRTLNRHRARLAVVIDRKDHIEKAACLGIMQHGGKVLSTYDIDEAKSWLAGEIF